MLHHLLLTFTDILINQMEARFGDRVGMLLLMPEYIISPCVRADEDKWLEDVTEAITLYKDELPSLVTMSTELMTWLTYWYGT